MFRYSGTGWRVAGSIETFGNQIMALRGNTDSYPTDGTLGDLAHSNRVSDHNPDPLGVVRAIDFHESSPGFVDEVAEQLRASKDPRLKYFIHDVRMFSSYATASRPAWAWGIYTGMNGHVNHGHLSVVSTTVAEGVQLWDIDKVDSGEDMALTEKEENTVKALVAALEGAGAGTLNSRQALLNAMALIGKNYPVEPGSGGAETGLQRGDTVTLT